MTKNVRMRPLLASALSAGLLLGACSDAEEPEVGEIGGEIEEGGEELGGEIEEGGEELGGEIEEEE